MDDLLRQLREIALRADAVAAEARNYPEMRPSQEGGWTAAQCFDHLARTNLLYLEAMSKPMKDARASGVKPVQVRYLPGFWGRIFVRSMEPSRYSLRMKSPATVVPSPAMSLAEAYDGFRSSHEQVERFAEANRGVDIAGVEFQNPFIRVLKLSVATGLYAVAAHERRHLQQAERSLRGK